MTVYVDQLRPVPAYAPPPLLRAGLVCHMMADTDDELEDMAGRIGMRKSWRHGDHYDLTPARRSLAMRYGAVEVNGRSLAELRRRKR